MATIFTIGHSNHSLDRFLSLLEQHGINVLVDTRSSPYSRYAPHFNSTSLKDGATARNIRYVFMGDKLGGRPEGAEFYDERGYVLYGRVAEAPLFQSGIERLQRGTEQYRVALLCSEEDPSICHRRLLITRVLMERGDEVLHIRGDGRVESEASLREAEQAAKKDPAQLTLFDLEEPEVEWKSLRPVESRVSAEP